MDRIERRLADVDWHSVRGGLWGNHEGPMSAVPDLWHSERIWDAVDRLGTAGFEFGTTRPVTPLLVPVLAAVLADPRSSRATVYEDVWGDRAAAGAPYFAAVGLPLDRDGCRARVRSVGAQRRRCGPGRVGAAHGEFPG